ncbi:response regulator [Amorphus orientalis]|uniref:CheY-like chemotaxis protein/predicted transcriptional regulator n=1 Tax=Amorphus orientalis TaxID=649198 RepID=A0AAE3VTL6_9HYPH|nr:response regulator [Amorphus orientalis]MDQ0317613.1 CheY-like chemotaxis protein/predicted transcriptional regulator [Amorphus orientalis]
MSAPKVLIVDDDPLVLEELGEGLEALGHPVLSANNANDALRLVDENPQLKIVVTDIQMPNINGIELLQKLGFRRKSRPLMAIVITGNASLDRAVAALRLQAVDFLQKPILPEEVGHAIDHALALSADSAGAAPSQNGAELPSHSSYLRALVAARTDRDAIFDSNLFSDPSWDMLLDLALAEASGRTISVTSLCLASGAPTTTALRRIDDLQSAGLIDRVPDQEDRRRLVVKLTDGGRKRMRDFVDRQTKRLGGGA